MISAYARPELTEKLGPLLMTYASRMTIMTLHRPHVSVKQQRTDEALMSSFYDGVQEKGGDLELSSYKDRHDSGDLTTYDT